MKSAKFAVAVLLSAVLISPSFAASPLPAGKPAGTKDAAFLAVAPLTLVFVGGFIGLLAVAGAGGFSGGTSPSKNTVTVTTTATSS